MFLALQLNTKSLPVKEKAFNMIQMRTIISQTCNPSPYPCALLPL